MTKSVTQRLSLALIIVIIGVSLTARFIPAPRNVDDSFITFRYARNIAQGNGFVYNPGVRTLGTTTPLFTLIMASVATLTGGENFPIYALIVSAFADAATAVLLFILMWRVTESIFPAAVVGLLWAIAPMSVTFAVGGMETSVAILWMVAATTSYVYDRKWLVGLFAGLGLLTRVDAALWILPLGIYQLIAVLITGHLDSKRLSARIPYQTWLAGLLTIAPWVIFSIFYFGSPLPNSLSAKSVAYIISGDTSALVSFVQRYATPFFEFDTFGASGAMVGAVVYPVLNLFALLYLWRREPRLLPFLLYVWLYITVFSVANPLVFRWYWLPPMPAWIFGAVVGAWSLVAAIGKRTSEKFVYPIGAIFLLLVWGGLSLNGWTLAPDHGPNRPAPKMAWHQLELYYEDIGTQLRDEIGVTEATLVASADIGAIGYFSRATIVDTVGLVTPQLSNYYPADVAFLVEGQNYVIPPALILDTQPAYFVTMEAFVRLGLAQMPEFTDTYELIRVIPTEFYGEGVYLYAQQ